jgi:hypothetical protein
MSDQSIEVTSNLSSKVTRRFALVLMLCAMAISVPVARAQVLYGSLTGTVTDSSGAVIVGANVTALETRTGVSQTTLTDSAGIYRFSNLLQGTYKITITAQGFSTQETPGVPVSVNDIKRVDASLKTAGATQEIVVTAAPPLLQTDSANVHTDLTAE